MVKKKTNTSVWKWFSFMATGMCERVSEDSGYGIG